MRDKYFVLFMFTVAYGRASFAAMLHLNIFLTSESDVGFAESDHR